MKIILPDKIMELDTNLDYADRITLVNDIITEYEDYFNEYWEDKKRKQGGYAQRVKIALDTLASYLLYGNTIEERKEEYKILNDSQLDYRRENEVYIDGVKCDKENVIDLVNKFKNNNVRKPTETNLKKYMNSKTHRFAVIRTKPELRYNRTIYVENTIYKHKWEIVDGKIDYECGKGKNIIINCFSENDKELPYIDGSRPYNFKWCWVDMENSFTFKNKLYKIINPYEFDTILVMEQDNNLYFFNGNVKNIANINIK